MNYFDIVPLRRTPLDRSSFTYRFPGETPPEVGALVEIPFRHRPALGIVWSVVMPPSDVTIHDITRVVLPAPLLNRWQRQVATALATSSDASLATILYSLIPKLTARTLARVFSTITEANHHELRKLPAERLWYQDRQQALDWIVDWHRRRQSSFRLTICPTVEDVAEVAEVLRTDGLETLEIHARRTPTETLEAWRQIRSGSVQAVVGTLRALTLPFPTEPEILLDQQEHHAHKQTAQHPRLDARVVLEMLECPYSVTTPAPSVEYFQRRGFEPPGAMIGRNFIGNLDRAGSFRWLTTEAETAIEQARQDHGRVLCIVPRRGYASAAECRNCGYAQECPKCHRRVSLFSGTAQHAICRACGTELPLTAACPRCGGTAWALRGIGVERTVEILQQQWPSLTIVPVADTQVPADIYVDSYAAYRQVRRLSNVRLIVFSNGDALLNIPDYATPERAWQYLARVRAEFPSGPILVQTFQPEQEFWQRWLHHDHQAWYRHELQERQRLGLPPFATQWILRIRPRKNEVMETQGRLQADYPDLTFTPLPASVRKSPTPEQRWLLTFANEPQAKSFPAGRFFPTPWLIDRHPQSWTD